MPERGAAAKNPEAMAERDDNLAQLERTLTDGYAEALELEAERSRLERQIAEVTQGIEEGDPAENARTLASLHRRLDGTAGALTKLRARLADLRRHASGIRGSEST